MRIDRIPSKKKNGKVHFSILLRHAYRNEEGKTRHRTLANLTHFPPEDILAIEWALKNKDLACILAKKEGDNPLRQGLSVGAVAAIYQILEDLGVVKVLGKSQEGKLVLWMIMARLIDQGSRLSSVRLAERHAVLEILGMKPFCEDHLYSSLSWLDKKQKEIEKRLYKLRRERKRKGKEKKEGGPEEELFFYDVTSSYLEGMNNGYGAYGYNRDGKRGKKQIVVGLLTDEEGFPVSIQVYPGNTADIQTFPDQVKKAQEAFGAKGVTFVGDRGMIKEKGCENLKKEGFHYITAITKVQIRSLLKKGAFQMELFDEGLGEFEYEGERYILRRNPIRAREMREKRQKKEEAFIEFVEKQNEYLSSHGRAKVEVAERKILEKGEVLDVLKWCEIERKDREFQVKRDEKKLKELEGLDGCYILRTNLRKEDGFSKELVHCRYKALAKIEGDFRSMKTEHLEMRPIYVQTKSHTRAHIFILMLAEMVKQKLEEYWKDFDLTVQEGIDELASLTSIEIPIGEKRIHHIPKPNPKVQKLLEAAHVIIPKALPCRKENVYTRKKLFEERKSK